MNATAFALPRLAATDGEQSLDNDLTLDDVGSDAVGRCMNQLSWRSL